MPTTVSGLTFFDTQFAAGQVQGVTQYIDAFNASSSGAIILEGGAARGRQPAHTYFQQTAGLIQARDPSGTGTLTPKKLANATQKSIKRFVSAPTVYSAQDWADLGMSSEQQTFLFGEQYGKQLAQTYINSAISALVGAVQAIGATAIYDYSGTGTFGYVPLNSGLGKMGDMRQSLVALVAHSKPLTDWIGTAFSTQTIAFQMGSTTVYNGSVPTMNMKLVNTDAPALFVDNTGTDHYWSIALVPGAVRIKEGPSRSAFSLVTGTTAATPENQTYLLSIESEFEIEVLGATWNVATNNPNDATLATAGSWAHATGASVDAKNGPGILIKSQ
jgi:hypothetical protein